MSEVEVFCRQVRDRSQENRKAISLLHSASLLGQAVGILRQKLPGKTRITIRIDDDILEWFRQQVDASGGGNYQTLMNEALRAAMQERKRPIETVLRKVVREELKRAGTSR
jgi:uncharacterized protein (DUF4415 family)